MGKFLLIFFAAVGIASAQPFTFNDVAFKPVIPSSGGGSSLNVSYVQSKATNNSDVGVTSSTFASTTAGDSIIVFIAQIFVAAPGVLPTSCASSGGNTYYQCDIFSNSAATFNPGIVAFIATNIIGGAETATVSGGSGNSSTYRVMTIEEYSGVHAVNTVSAASPAATSVSLPFTATKQFVITCLDYNYNNPPAVAASSYSSTSWTLRNNFSVGGDVESYGDWLNPATGYPAGSGTVTLTTTASGKDAAMALFLQ